MSEPTAEEKRAALVERVAKCIASWAGCEDCGTSASYTSEVAEKVLDLLAADGRLIEPGDLQSSVGAVFGLWQEAKAKLADARAEAERLRDELRLVTGERDKFGFALDVMHAQQIRTENERDTARAESDRLRTLLTIRGETLAASGRISANLRTLLAEALDGWERAVDREHAANCFDEHDPEQCRPPRIAEIRREAGL